MNWFRWYHGTVTDPKLALIAHLSGEPMHLVLAVWASLLEVASQSNPRGDISSFDPECHAVTLQALQKQIVTILDFMHQKDMINKNEICKWGKRQFGSESLERVRKYRENNKNKNVTDVTVTPCNVTSVTSVNVTPEENIKTLSSDKKNKRFSEPSLDEIADYCKERNNGVDASAWLNHYQAKGWMIGNAKMKDWKAAVRTWEKRSMEIAVSNKNNSQQLYN